MLFGELYFTSSRTFSAFLPVLLGDRHTKGEEKVLLSSKGLLELNAFLIFILLAINVFNKLLAKM